MSLLIRRSKPLLKRHSRLITFLGMSGCLQRSKPRFFSFTHLEHIAVTLTLLSELAPNPQLKTPQSSLCFSRRCGLDAFLAASTELFKNDHTEISYFFEVAPDEQELIHREIDLIVSNFDLHLKSNTKFQQLRISNVPTLSDWRSSTKTIEQLIQPRITPIRWAMETGGLLEGRPSVFIAWFAILPFPKYPFSFLLACLFFSHQKNQIFFARFFLLINAFPFKRSGESHCLVFVCCS